MSASSNSFCSLRPLRLCGIFFSFSGLTRAYQAYILVCMRTTLNIDDAILSRAAELTGVREKTSLVRMGLEALVSRASADRLAALGGTEKKLKPIPRRRGPTR